MKKQFLLLLSIAAVSALAACNINVKPSSSSLAPADTSSESSSEEPSSSSDSSSESSSSSSSSSQEEDIGPVPGTIEIPTVEDEQKFPASAGYSKDLLLNYHALTLVAGSENNSTATLRGLPRALQSGSNLAFRSLDASIASVDENGVVTAVKSGSTSIEVSDKAHPDVKRIVPVDVFDNLVPAVVKNDGTHYTQDEIDAAQPGDPAYGKTTSDWEIQPASEAVDNDKAKIALITDQLTSIDESGLTEIVDHELREMSTYKNGVRQQYNVWDEHLVCSKDEAYFRLYETDGDTKTEDGAMSFADYEWIFNTNKFYDTYVYHTSGTVKNYYPISTVDYMPENPDVNKRYAPMYEVLDNIFTIGHEIFTDTLEDASMKGLFDAKQGLASHDFTNVVKNCVGGFLDDNGDPSSLNDFFFDCVLFFPDEKASQDAETNYGIPYGTPTPTTQRMIYTVKDGKLVSYRLELVENYKIGDDFYKKVYYIDHYYERITDENRDSYMIIPDVKDYTLVDYLFAI